MSRPVFVKCGSCGKYISIEHCRAHIKECKGDSSEGFTFFPLSSIPEADYVELTRMMLKYDRVIRGKGRLSSSRNWKVPLVFFFILIGIGFLLYIAIGGS